MKRLISFLLITIVCMTSAMAQTAKTEDSENQKFPFAIKAYPFRGMYLDKGVHWDKFAPAGPAGVHMGFELPSRNLRPW